MAAPGSELSVKQLVKLAILKEVFMSGSLLKSEIAEIIARKPVRNAQLLKKMKSKSMEELTVITDEACDELTIEHILIGVIKSSANEAVSLNDADDARKDY